MSSIDRRTPVWKSPMTTPPSPDLKSILNAVGQPLRRKEDIRLLTGKGRFSDDFSLDGQAYACRMPGSSPSTRRRRSPCPACSPC
jgi:aerobic carbon-monoxide dehydrogenase large subunit